MHAPLDPTPSVEEMNTLIKHLMWGVNASIFRAIGDCVVGGPFATMAIPERAPWDDGNSGAKLLGSYEHELHDTIAHAEWREPKVVVNVGCAEGYYAIGLAKKWNVPVYGFDTDDESRELCWEYARKNGVSDKLLLAYGIKDPRDLRLPEVKGHRLYLFDCEGDELDLVDPVACMALVNADIIVECHDFLKPHTSRTIADRLAATHNVHVIRQSLPDFTRYRYLTPSVISLLTVAEKRPIPCCWLVCWANRRGD